VDADKVENTANFWDNYGLHHWVFIGWSIDKIYKDLITDMSEGYPSYRDKFFNTLAATRTVQFALDQAAQAPFVDKTAYIGEAAGIRVYGDQYLLANDGTNVGP
jgi:hypothetical protein